MEAVRLRIEPVTLAFVCVYIPKAVFETLGELDERFSGYGFDDNDYCARVLAAGLELAVCDGCVVEHGVLPPTFRSRPGWRTLSKQNEELYVEKWRAVARAADRPVDLVYLAHNRLEFVRETFEALWRNTNWTLVRELTIVDRGSVDGTDGWLEAEAARMPVPTRFVRAPGEPPGGATGSDEAVGGEPDRSTGRQRHDGRARLAAWPTWTPGHDAGRRG